MAKESRHWNVTPLPKFTCICLCLTPPSPNPGPRPLPPLPQRTQRPWTRPKDHLRERGDPLCYVSAREWNNMESSSANNSQWRSFSTCCLTKGKIRTDDVLSFLSQLSSFTPYFFHFVLLLCWPEDAGVWPVVALLTSRYEIPGLFSNSHWHWVSHFFMPSLGWG